MTAETVIRVENLSKQYRLGVIGSRTLCDDVARLPARLRCQPDPTRKIGQSPVADLQPLTSMRRAIAEHMQRSMRTSPHVMSLFEADMTAVVRHRESHRAEFSAKGIGLTFTPYFVAATAAALRAHPEVNSSFSAEGLLDRKSTRLNSSHIPLSRMPSSA